MRDYRNIFALPAGFCAVFMLESSSDKTIFSLLLMTSINLHLRGEFRLQKANETSEKKINEIPYFTLIQIDALRKSLTFPFSLSCPEINNMLLSETKHGSKHSFAHNEASSFEGVPELLGIDSCLMSRTHNLRLSEKIPIQFREEASS